ncbi:MAG: methyltransferase domain-containing protein [Anaerolineales bacterium]|jgi:ubiquinone/menaquinone biosynthesis C-methylase UbiE
MTDEPASSKKLIGTRDWYDFVGQLSGILPGMHMGGQDATDKLLAMCQMEATSHVLDVGCGAGNTACLIAKRFGSKVKGIDISEVMIEKAKERAQREALTHLVEFRVEDVLELPFDSNAFDAVIVESVLTPLPGDKQKAMAEMVRVLRPGGRVAANEGTVDPSAPAEFLALLEEHPAFHTSFTPESLKDLFERSGLRVVQMVEADHGKPPKALEDMGCGGLLSFMVRDYAKMLIRLLRDKRLRKASRTDDQLKKLGSEYTGYVLIVGQKPS